MLGRVLEFQGGRLSELQRESSPMPPSASSAALAVVSRDEALGSAHLGAAAPTGALAPAARYLTAEQEHTLDRAIAGDERALRTIYVEHAGQVRAHLYRLLGPDPELDDVLQTVFARAFNALPSFQRNASLSTWLYRITANTTHNLLRQRFRRDRVKRAFQWFQHSRGPDRSAGGVDTRDEAERILQQLRPDLREVFVLYHYEGLTLQEISAVLGRPISTVGDRLTRARQQLRELVS
jgi:RNA polymerase sigma-70 factor (ECF subfamily)